MPRDDQPPPLTPEAAPPEPEKWIFRGFTSPNTTAVPDEFFDQLAPRLKEAELRVCLYIIRRTFGWKKSSDDISLRQMVEGIRTKDGRQLDLGTGMSKPAVTKAVSSLVARRVLVTNRNRSLERGDEATTYALNVNPASASGVPVLTKLTRGCSLGLPPPVNLVNPQETAVQKTEKQQQDATVLSDPWKADPQPEGFDVVDHNLDRLKSSASSPVETPDQLKEALVRRGMGVSTAMVMVRDIPPQLIREKIALFDWAKQHRPALITRSDGGWLRMAITTNYPLPVDFTTGGQREAQRRLEAERQAKKRLAELEQIAKDMAELPSVVAEQRLRVQDRFADTRRAPRLAGEEREAFRAQQEAQHTAAAVQWFVEHPDCAHLKPAWLTVAADDRERSPETSWKGPGSFSRGSDGLPRPIGQVLAERPITQQISGPQDVPPKPPGSG